MDKDQTIRMLERMLEMVKDDGNVVHIAALSNGISEGEPVQANGMNWRTLNRSGISSFTLVLERKDGED